MYQLSNGQFCLHAGLCYWCQSVDINMYVMIQTMDRQTDRHCRLDSSVYMLVLLLWVQSVGINIYINSDHEHTDRHCRLDSSVYMLVLLIWVQSVGINIYINSDHEHTDRHCRLDSRFYMLVRVSGCRYQHVCNDSELRHFQSESAKKKYI